MTIRGCEMLSRRAETDRVIRVWGSLILAAVLSYGTVGFIALRLPRCPGLAFFAMPTKPPSLPS